MTDLSDLIANAVTENLTRLDDDNQALRLALLAVLSLTEEGGELPKDFREFLILHFQPLAPYWDRHLAPFTEGFRVARGRDTSGNIRLFLSEDFIRSLVPNA